MVRQCPVCDNAVDDQKEVCDLCGFRFLGSTEKMQPIKLTGDQGRDGMDVVHQFDLRVIRGPMTGTDINLHPGTLSIGRDPCCDIFLNDMTVSREHATLEVGQGPSIIRDQGSVNGVWVNDRMVEAAALKPGDLLQIGAFCLIYQERL